jgi:PAS domain S-box-containing protein
MKKAKPTVHQSKPQPDGAEAVFPETAQQPAEIPLQNQAVSNQIEDALQANTAIVQALIDATPESMLLVDAEGTVLALNEIAALRLGKPRHELIGRSSYDFFPADVANQRARRIKQVLDSSEPVSFADERAGRHYYNSLYPVLDAAGKVDKIAIFAQDLTMQHQTELALRESEEKYRQLFEHESDAVMVFDAETMRFEDANLATLALFGYTKEEFLGLTVENISAEKEKTKAAVQSIKDGDPGSVHVPLRYFTKKDGTVFPGEIYTGKFISAGRQKIIEAVRDITESVRFQEALQMSERRFRHLFNSVPIGLYRTTPGGEILDANPALLGILGYPDLDSLLQANTIQIYLNPNDRIQLQHRLEQDGFVHDFTVQMRRYDGRIIWVAINVRIIRDNDLQKTYYDGAMLDISDRKLAEEHIHSLSQQLMKAHEDERQMISRELHDRVAQELSSLKIASDSLLDNQPSVSAEIRQKIAQFSSILDGTITSVRDLSYDLRPPGLDDMGLGPALSMYCDDFSEKSGVQVDFTSAGIDNFTLDPDIQIHIYRLIQEGLNNIRKHADASRAVVKLVGSFPNIILRIKDNGKGFDVAERARSSDSRKRMGLRSMAERVNLLNGRMTVESRPMQGTKIDIKFPYQEKPYGPKKDPHHR